MPSVRRRRRDFHVAGLGDGRGHEGHRALGDIEQRGVLFAAVLVDKTVDRKPRIGGQIERGGVIEGDAKCGIRRGLQHVVEKMSSFGLSAVAWLLRVTVRAAGSGLRRCRSVHIARGLRIRGRIGRWRRGV